MIYADVLAEYVALDPFITAHHVQHSVQNSVLSDVSHVGMSHGGDGSTLTCLPGCRQNKMGTRVETWMGGAYLYMRVVMDNAIYDYVTHNRNIGYPEQDGNEYFQTDCFQREFQRVISAKGRPKPVRMWLSKCCMSNQHVLQCHY